jgi:hypothetical protein
MNARLESAALTTSRAMAEISKHWDAVYEATRRSEEKPPPRSRQSRGPGRRAVSGNGSRSSRCLRELSERDEVGMERDPPKPMREDRRPGGSQHPNHAGDRLSRVDVVFEVASERYPLDERAATRMAENLRVKAAHEPGAEGTVGARAVADAIELRLIEDTADPITLGGDEAEAVFYAPEVPNGGSDRLSALRDAVKRLHEEWIR